MKELILQPGQYFRQLLGPHVSIISDEHQRDAPIMRSAFGTGNQVNQNQAITVAEDDYESVVPAVRETRFRFFHYNGG